MNGEGVRSGAVSVVKTHKRIAVSWTMEDQPSMADHDTNKKVHNKNSCHYNNYNIILNLISYTIIIIYVAIYKYQN